MRIPKGASGAASWVRKNVISDRVSLAILIYVIVLIIVSAIVVYSTGTHSSTSTTTSKTTTATSSGQTTYTAGHSTTSPGSIVGVLAIVFLSSLLLRVDERDQAKARG